MSSIELNPAKSSFFEIEAVLRAHSNVIEVLELDGILTNRDVSDEHRMAQAQALIEQFVQRISDGQQI
jgi:hypothetical protein